MGFGAIFALLPDFQSAIGFSDAWLGTVTAASFAAGFVAQIGLARYADRGWGRHLLIGGVALAVVGIAGVAVARSVTTLVLARIVLGLGEGAFLPAARRIVILRNPNDVGSALGQVGSAATFGFLTGPVVASLIADRHGFRAPFWAIAIVVALLLPVLVRFDVPPASGAIPSIPVRGLLRLRGVRAGLLLGMSLNVAIGVYDSLWAKFLKDDHGASTQFVGWSLFVFAMPMVVMAPISGRLSDRIGPIRLGSTCAIASVPFIAAYGWLPNAWAISGFAILHSVFDSGVFPSAQSAVARAGPPEMVAAGQGLLDGFGLLTAALSAVAFAHLYDAAGAEVLWVTLAACVGLSGVSSAMIGRGLFQNTRSASTESRSRRDIARSTAESP